MYTESKHPLITVDDSHSLDESMENLMTQVTNVRNRRLMTQQLQDIQPNLASPYSANDGRRTTLSIETEKNAVIARPKYVHTPGIVGPQVAAKCGWSPDHQVFPNIQQNLLLVVSSLGHGSLGVVEQVRVSSTFSTFVRKRVQLPYHGRKKRLQIIKDEADVLKSLNHPHIINVLGSYEEAPPTGNHFYSVLMFPVGDSDLKNHLDMIGDMMVNQGDAFVDLKVQKQRLKRWILCLASALAYIHYKGVRHQDIKPSNIIVRQNEIYFTDFSSAGRFNIGQTTSTENPGRTSAMYAAPEIISSDGFLLRHGRGTDVFALGAVFSEMLAIVNGYTIHEFHEFLLREQKPRTAGILLYGRCTARINQYLESDKLYHSCIRDMLATDREQRPSAESVADRLYSYCLFKNQCCKNTYLF
jgi:serine/threonine protein kinase